MSERMNFLFIFTDQQRADHLRCYNKNMVLKTPNIDRIAEEGIKFTRFYCNNPICMPNRSTIYTGQYPSVHGVTTNGRNLPQGTRTFVDILLESGLYHTASFGKIHLNYFGFPIKKFNKQTESQEYSQAWDYHRLTNYSPYFGLEEVELVCGHGTLCGHPDYLNWIKEKMKNEQLRKLFRMKPNTSDATLQDRINWSFKTKGSFLNLQVLRHKVPEELYSTTFVKERTINFLEKFTNGKYSKNNFFAFCSFPDPHHPYTPPGKYFGMYKPEDIILPKSFNDKHEKSPEFMKLHYNETLHTEGTTKGLFPNPKDVTELDAKRVIAASYGMEKMIDDAVGEILSVLDKTGLAENTVIIYTTDHGELGGDHHFFFKGPYLYQGLVKIPFIIKIPNGLKNKVTTSLASSIDIPETILELTGFPIPDNMQGKSLVPILEKPDTKIHNSILIEMDDEITINESSRSLIMEDWRITVFSEAYIGQLFNLKEDPDELNNLWDDKSFSDKKSELILKLMRKNTKNLRNPVIRDCQF
ncbi:MAG: sulfatase [Candidatus Hodarchaeota archaeon]